MEAAVQNILIATSCAIAGALINSFFGKKKQNAEIEGMIVTNYQKILEDLRLEVGRLRDRIGEVEAKELLYMEQSNLLLRDKQELSIRILQLEKDNKYLFEENQKLKKALTELKK
jgi:hypothetical protein